MDCARCGGLTLAERFFGASRTAGAWSYDGLRCVNCGAIAFVEPAPNRASDDSPLFAEPA